MKKKQVKLITSHSSSVQHLQMLVSTISDKADFAYMVIQTLYHI